MARKKIREYDSKRLLKEHYKRITGGDELGIKSAQVRCFIRVFVSCSFVFLLFLDRIMCVLIVVVSINRMEMELCDCCDSVEMLEQLMRIELIR